MTLINTGRPGAGAGVGQTSGEAEEEFQIPVVAH
jgi:hypothetical protein